MIRGLGFRVVVINDGIRQEGQQFGDEFGIEIDPYTVDKVEILRGPASLSYGSDAMAGVINMLAAPTLPDGQIKERSPAFIKPIMAITAVQPTLQATKWHIVGCPLHLHRRTCLQK